MGSQFCQKVNFNLSEEGFTMEFIYINPLTKEEEVVARVTLPEQAVQQLPIAIKHLLDEQNAKKRSAIKAHS